MLARRGWQRGRAIPAGSTRYQRRHGVQSEREYKERAKADGTITYYINLGLKTWPETRDALLEIEAACRHRGGLRVDRVSLTADRRMGLPPAQRASAIEETGIMFWSETDWAGTGSEVDVQGILNDHAVGSPASVVNAEAAIRAGISYVGNLAQMSYGYPGVSDDVEQMAQTVEAIGIVAAHRGNGVVLDSYIDDGFCATFHDAATSLAWCMFHHHVASHLIGAAHAPSYGSTFADPTLKAAYGLAMDAINPEKVPPSLVHGDTNSLRLEDSFDRSAVIVANDVFFTIASQLAHPTGAAVHATPLSEPHRIPTIEDVVQSLEIGNEAERRAREALHLVDWRPAHALRDEIVRGGRTVLAAMMAGLTELGVDTNDPLQCLLATRRLGAARIEEMWGAGEPDTAYPRGFKPVAETDTLRRLRDRQSGVLANLHERPDLLGLTIVVASGDIHEYGLWVVANVLRELGANVVDLGTSVDNDLIIQAAAETAADAVALSTYNGMALTLGRDLAARAARRGLTAPLFVGGRLTEDVDGGRSVDVSERLAADGLVPCPTLEHMIARLRPAVADRA